MGACVGTTTHEDTIESLKEEYCLPGNQENSDFPQPGYVLQEKTNPDNSIYVQNHIFEGKN